MLSGMFAPDMVKIPEVPPTKAKSRSKSSVYVEGPIWERLDQIAQELGRSRNLLVRGILSDWVTEYDAEKEKKTKHR